MKTIVQIATVAFLIWACSPAKQVSKTSASLVLDTHDSTEYELVITDLYFENWYNLNYSPAKDHTNEYYRSKNQVAVINWNDYYRQGLYDRVIETPIDYRNELDYGIEVNRKLYWYFKYITEAYKIRLFMNRNPL